jgi:hypothetical protein
MCWNGQGTTTVNTSKYQGPDWYERLEQSHQFPSNDRQLF